MPRLLQSLSCLTAVCSSIVAVSGQIIVYDNLADPNWVAAYPTALVTGNDEVGDQIILDGNVPQTLLSYSLQYFTDSLSGDEQMRVRFYENDGPIVQGAASPGSVLYDSGSLPVTLPTGRGVLTLDNLNVSVPASFTWSVQFSGVTAGEGVGVSIHGPAAVGSSQVVPADDFWEVVSGAWKLSQLTTGSPPPPSSFGAQMTVVPEPSGYGLMAAVMLLSFGAYRRFRLG